MIKKKKKNENNNNHEINLLLSAMFVKNVRPFSQKQFIFLNLSHMITATVTMLFYKNYE